MSGQFFACVTVVDPRTQTQYVRGDVVPSDMPDLDLFVVTGVVSGEALPATPTLDGLPVVEIVAGDHFNTGEGTP